MNEFTFHLFETIFASKYNAMKKDQSNMNIFMDLNDNKQKM